MNVVLFGATGMIGQGVLREALLDPSVGRVLAIGRRATGQHHEKLEEHVVPDVADLCGVEARLPDFGACLFCLGVSSAGMSEARYTELTHDLTLAVARALVQANPDMVFLFVSGQGTDSTEQGRMMWARVKGRAENALMRLPFRAAYMFRPGIVIPLHGITSRTVWARRLYAITKPLHGMLQARLPSHVTTTERLGRAMLAVARDGYSEPILETRDINSVDRP